MEFILTDRAEHSARITINHDIVRFNATHHAGVKNRGEGFALHDATMLLECIEDLAGQPGESIELAMSCDAQMGISLIEFSEVCSPLEDMVSLHVEGPLGLGADFCVPLSVVRAVLSDDLVRTSASPASDRRFPTTFILSDRRDHCLLAFITDETVRLVISQDDADNCIRHDSIYSTSGLLQDIKEMVALSQDGDIALDVGDATKLIIRFRKTKADVIELHLGGSDFEGAGLVVPLSLVQSVLSGTGLPDAGSS